MAQTKHRIQELLSLAGSHPRHRFGQNFMIDQNLVRLVALSAELSPEDLVIEVGPGTGTLTEELLALGVEVLAVEIDRDLAELLRGQFGQLPRFRLIEGDALAGKHELNADMADAIAVAQHAGRTVKLVANLPYNIASPLVIECLLAGVQTLVFVVQKEVGERLKAIEGTGEYGPLTVMAQLLAEVEMLRKLPPGAFWPAPRIESGLMRLRRRDRLGTRAAAFHDFLHRVFASRRKTLRKSLDMAGFPADELLRRLGLNGQCRAEELSPPRLLELFVASASSP